MLPLSGREYLRRLSTHEEVHPSGIYVFFDFYKTYFMFGTFNFPAFEHVYFMYPGTVEEVEDFPGKRWETGVPIRSIPYMSR
ncbi:hypothetical protein DFH09DRAFT_1321169 [Mycena vulgaris]|nr:hypothetical protein DFH09DRAFT_1321169 [Mycena vulgaris]